jgi:N-acetylglucosamine-6-sulfatase
LGVVIIVSRHRTVLGLASAAALACPLVTAAGPAGATEPAAAAAVRRAVDPPNIVVVMTDDQPNGFLGVMPNVQSLVQAPGVTFTHAIAPTPLCAPSRASLLTGLKPSDTGIYGNSAPSGGWVAFHDLGLERSTLATWLNAAGYRTALVGKYLNGFGEQSPKNYVPPGWDEFAGLLQRHGSYYDYGLRVKDGAGVRNVAYGSDPEDYSTTVLASYAVDTITRTPPTTPLFLVYAPVAPHAPTVPAPEQVGSVPLVRPSDPDVNEADMSDKPVWLRDHELLPWPKVTRKVARQQETLISVDQAVGEIVSALGDRMDNTLFVFMSDNGTLDGSHRLLGKTLAYRRSAEVPLVLRWDGHLSPRTDGHIVTTLDVSRTIVAAAGISRRTAGRSLLRTPRRTGTLIAAEQAESPGFCAWRTRRWLYVQYSGRDGTELYDYRADPFELTNLVADPDYRRTLHTMRDRARSACDPAPPGFQW